MKKVLLWTIASVFGVSALAALSEPSTPVIAPTPTAYIAPAPATGTLSLPSATPQALKYQSPTELSNDNYYQNVDGIKVHAPAYAPTIPEGASARCRDGTYSFSLNRRGTCSHHGGVAEWY